MCVIEKRLRKNSRKALVYQAWCRANPPGHHSLLQRVPNPISPVHGHNYLPFHEVGEELGVAFYGDVLVGPQVLQHRLHLYPPCPWSEVKQNFHVFRQL